MVNLPTIPESNETVPEIESAHLRSRSEKLIPRKSPSFEFSSTATTRPPSRQPPRAVIEKLPQPPPELDDDTGSESSSSDEDLDAYEFDLSSFSGSYLEHSVDVPTQTARIYDKPKNSRVKEHSNTSVRVANPLEADISSIYESITRRTLTRISL